MGKPGFPIPLPQQLIFTLDTPLSARHYRQHSPPPSACPPNGMPLSRAAPLRFAASGASAGWALYNMFKMNFLYRYTARF